MSDLQNMIDQAALNNSRKFYGIIFYKVLATDRSKAVVLVWFFLNVFGIGVSGRNLCSCCCLFICKR